MAVQIPQEYVEIQGIGDYVTVRRAVHVAKTKALDENGGPIVNISWYDTKLWVQEHGLLLPEIWRPPATNLRLSEDMRKLPGEWTDRLLVWPDPKTGEYQSNLDPKPTPGEYALLITGSIVERMKNGNYAIRGGKRVELGFLFDSSANGQLFDEVNRQPYKELAFVSATDIFREPRFGDGKFQHYVMLPRPGIGNLLSAYPPSERSSNIGFRPARKQIVEAEKAGEGFVQIPIPNWRAVQKLIGELDSLTQE